MTAQTGELLQKFNPRKILIVTDKGVRGACLLDGIESSLREQKLIYAIFDEVEPSKCRSRAHKGD